MSDYIPFEIQVQIIKRFPVKSLAQFRSVSKQWKSLIDSSEFIAGFSSPHTQLQRLLVWYEEGCGNTGEKCISLVDDETFALKEVVRPAVPVLAEPFKKTQVVGSSHGLLCLCDLYQNSFRGFSGTKMAVLWNPLIRKSVGIVVPGGLVQGFQTVLGFGVCPTTNDPTLVKITSGRSRIPSVVEVFSLTAGVWKTPSNSLPKHSIRATWTQVVIDRFIYWFANDMKAATGELILSFDMTTHEFSVVDLPFSTEHPFCNGVTISKVFDSLAVLEYIEFPGEQACNVWSMMDHGDPNSLTLLFSINTPYEFMRILSFSKSGKPIMETNDDYNQPAALVVYEPCSESFNDIEIYGNYGSFFGGTYIETLLLIDQLDCRVYQTSTDNDDGYGI